MGDGKKKRKDTVVSVRRGVLSRVVPLLFSTIIVNTLLNILLCICLVLSLRVFDSLFFFPPLINCQ